MLYDLKIRILENYMNKIIKFALIQTTPVMIGYIFIGIAFGLLLADSGYGRLWALSMAIIVYGVSQAAKAALK